MSETRSCSGNHADDELQQALAAAFGEDALGWLSDEHLEIDESPKEVESANLTGTEFTLDQKSFISGPRYLICEIGDRQFGLSLGAVTEIVRQATITPLPRTPAWLRGVTNLRGQIVSVIELRELWNVTASTRRQSTRERIVVVHNATAAAHTAIVVDQILGIESPDDDQQFNSHENGTHPEIVSGLISVDQTPIVLIDADRLLDCAKLQRYAT
jgi:purine-binding chemotaxis protein CheW